MASKKLTDTNISDTYRGVLHARGQALRTDGIVESVYDGLGTKSALSVGINSIEVTGDGKFRSSSNSNTGVYLSSNQGGIELVQNGTSDNPFIDFKSSVSEDYDCRIIKNSNGLEIWTGGNSNRKRCAIFGNAQNFRVYGQLLLGEDTGDGFPGVHLDATRVGQLDKLKLYSNDVISLYTAGTTEVNARLTVAADGKVGIGTTSPQKKLHVVGQMRYEHGTPEPGKVMQCGSSDGNVNWEYSTNSVYFDGANTVSLKGCTITRISAGKYNINVTSNGTLPTAVASLANGWSTYNRWYNGMTTYQVSARVINNTTIRVETIERIARNGHGGGNDNNAVAFFSQYFKDLPFCAIISR